ncbi:MAG: polysaccharide deacetylase family protein [Chloroflexota bacterium]|nr:polysaccharide deacetylase family protein [Chloroflexota bacterium]
MLAGAIAFALVRTGAIGGSSSDDSSNPSTGTPAVVVITDPPTGSHSPSATASPKPGPPITSPVDVPIMMYHIIGPPDRPANDALAVSTEDFKAQMSYLACAGYTPITMQRLFDAFDGKESLPPKPIILTFDDGWAGQYTYGFPVLQQHGFLGSFAIVTGFVDAGGPYVTWAQILEMSGAGMEMMSHTVTHIDLGSTDDATDIDQLQKSKSTLQAHIGHAVDYFVYPSGEPFRSGTAERQAQVVQMLKNAGYRGALLDNNGYGSQDPARPYELNRVRVSGGEGIYAYAGSIYGVSPDTLNCR